MIRIKLDASRLGLVMQKASHECADYTSTAHVWEHYPDVSFICPGPMADDKFTPLHLLARYFDGKVGVDVKGRYWIRQGATLSVLDGRPHFAPWKITTPGATFALQGWPRLVWDGRVDLEPGMPNTSAPRWRTALCLSKADEVFVCAAPMALPEFCERVRVLGAERAVYLDGGHSAYYQIRGGEPEGDPRLRDPRSLGLACWLVQHGEAPVIERV